MSHWEYCVFEWHQCGHDADYHLYEKMKELGELEWELVGVTKDNNHIRHYFKRPLNVDI